MRLSKDEVAKIQDWITKNNYDYVEWKKDDVTTILGYRVDTLKLREKKE